MKKNLLKISAIALMTGCLLTGCGNNNQNFGSGKDMLDYINKIYEKSADIEAEAFVSYASNLSNKGEGQEQSPTHFEDEMNGKYFCNNDFTAYTGLKERKNVYEMAVSFPMISTNPYSLAVVRLNENTDIEKVKKEMLDGIDVNRWLCTRPEVVYVDNYNDLVIVIVATKDYADLVHNSFVSLFDDYNGNKLVRNIESPEF